MIVCEISFLGSLKHAGKTGRVIVLEEAVRADRSGSAPGDAPRGPRSPLDLGEVLPMNRFSWPMLAAALVFWATPTTSRAGYELVVNGGFETGNFAGWTAGPENFVSLEYGLGGGYGVQYGAVGV